MTAVGVNPPWLSYHDIADDAYKARIKDLVFKFALLEKSEGKLFTQMDTSTLFFVHCQREFLKPGGTIAFVLPKTTILPAKQHAGFQSNGFSKVHDMSKVRVTGLVNQHFFNVKSCVVIRGQEVATSKVPMEVWSGELPRKNLTWVEAEPLLDREEEAYSFLAVGGPVSPYYDRAFQGATLNPHTLWFVEPDPNVPLNTSRPALRTDEVAFTLCKEKKWKFRVSGPVEGQFLFATVLSDPANCPRTG